MFTVVVDIERWQCPEDLQNLKQDDGQHIQKRYKTTEKKRRYYTKNEIALKSQEI